MGQGQGQGQLHETRTEQLHLHPRFGVRQHSQGGARAGQAEGLLQTDDTHRPILTGPAPWVARQIWPARTQTFLDHRAHRPNQVPQKVRCAAATSGGAAWVYGSKAGSSL